MCSDGSRCSHILPFRLLDRTPLQRSAPTFQKQGAARRLGCSATPLQRGAHISKAGRGVQQLMLLSRLIDSYQDAWHVETGCMQSSCAHARRRHCVHWRCHGLQMAWHASIRRGRRHTNQADGRRSASLCCCRLVANILARHGTSSALRLQPASLTA